MENNREQDKSAALAAVMGAMGKSGIVHTGMALLPKTVLPPRRGQPAVTATPPRTAEEVAARRLAIQREREEQESASQRGESRRAERERIRRKAAKQAKIALMTRRWKAKHAQPVAELEPHLQSQPIEQPERRNAVYTGHPMFEYFTKWLNGRKPSRRLAKEFWKFVMQKTKVCTK
jgi:hypothetical protein